MIAVLIQLLFPGIIQGTTHDGTRPLSMAADQGVIDLSGWLPSEHSHITLDGTWEFYWEQLLTPESFKKNTSPSLTGYISVPGLWYHFKENGLSLPRDGYATFRLQLTHIPTDAAPLYLYMREVPTAYRLWINGKEVAGNGVVGTSAKEMKPWFQPEMIRIDSHETTMEMIIQVSNFYHKDGGLWYSIELGSGPSFAMKSMRLMLFDMLFFGSLMIMGIYHLALFALRPKDKAPLYFALFCLCIGLRSVMIGQRITYMMFPALPWSIQQKLEFGLLYLSFPAFLLFFYHVFPRDVSLRLIRPVIGFILLLGLTVVLTPVKFFAHTALWFQIILFIMVAYILVRLIRIIRMKREGGIIFLCGFCVLFVAAVHDTLYTHLLIQSRSIAHVSVFLFIIFQSFLLSKKFSGAFYKVEEMTETLKDKNKKLIEADELKNEFLANTSHELRTPLHGIMGLAESMLTSGEETLDNKQKKDLSLIATSGRRLFNLINDLLDFSKIRKQELDLTLRSVDLKGLCRLVIEFSTPLIAGKDVVIEEEIPDDLPPVMADEDRLQQILFNLVGNAVKFTPKGRIVIRADLSGNTINISVSDTGIGIAPEDQERVFNPFEQADGSSERMFPGTGLGLAISRKLVMLHGSQLRLKSDVGHGSEFSFMLKASTESVKPQDEGVPANKRWFHIPGDKGVVVSDLHAKHHGGQKTILVVDDEPINVELVSTYLEADNRYSVITAGSGYEALERIEDEPDLILLDVMMPGMNGFEVCRTLRKNPLTQTLPIIILSAKNQINDLVQGLESGANDYLPKPFYKEELLARIQAHLNAAESVKQLEINRQLHEEIKRRKSVEQELRISRRKLARILDSATDAMIVSDMTGMITFFNHGAESLFGYTTNEALHQSVDLMLEETSIGDFRKQMQYLLGNPMERSVFTVRCKRYDNDQFNASAYLSSFIIDEEQYCALIVKPVQPDLPAVESDRSIQAMENSFVTISDYVGRDGRSGQADLRGISPALDDTHDTIDKNNHDDLLRIQIVETMATALSCWEISTGKTRIELSEDSGIWKAYLDGGTWKTRTLDKYLNLNTLPTKPRWREVLRTAHFVLSHCNGTASIAEKLKANAEELEKALKYSRRTVC